MVQDVYGRWQALLGSIQERQKLFDVVQVRDLSSSKVLVGCTTSGAAKYRHDNPPIAMIPKNKSVMLQSCSPLKLH